MKEYITDKLEAATADLKKSQEEVDRLKASLDDIAKTLRELGINNPSAVAGIQELATKRRELAKTVLTLREERSILGKQIITQDRVSQVLLDESLDQAQRFTGLVEVINMLVLGLTLSKPRVLTEAMELEVFKRLGELSK